VRRFGEKQCVPPHHNQSDPPWTFACGWDGGTVRRPPGQMNNCLWNPSCGANAREWQCLSQQKQCPPGDESRCSRREASGKWFEGPTGLGVTEQERCHVIRRPLAPLRAQIYLGRFAAACRSTAGSFIRTVSMRLARKRCRGVAKARFRRLCLHMALGMTPKPVTAQLCGVFRPHLPPTPVKAYHPNPGLRFHDFLSDPSISPSATTLPRREGGHVMLSTIAPQIVPLMDGRECVARLPVLRTIIVAATLSLSQLQPAAVLPQLQLHRTSQRAAASAKCDAL
jgi:hypothetical protein